MVRGSIPSQERFFSFQDSERLRFFFLKSCEVFRDYKFVMLPSVEMYDPEVYTDSYKPVVIGTGADGDILNLRADWTISLARFLSSIKHLELPIKVYYWGNVFSSTGDMERFQTGIEHLGTEDTDAEVVQTISEYLKACGVDDFVVSVGHMGIVSKMVKEHNYEERQGLIKALYEKNFSQLEPYPSIRDLLYFQGDKSMVESFCEKRPEFEKECSELLRLSKALKGIEISFDLSEIRLQNYYTGLIFEFFHPNVGHPIAGGGRYDKLYSLFGKDIKAVGCAVYLDRLL